MSVLKIKLTIVINIEIFNNKGEINKILRVKKFLKKSIKRNPTIQERTLEYSLLNTEIIENLTCPLLIVNYLGKNAGTLPDHFRKTCLNLDFRKSSSVNIILS